MRVLKIELTQASANYRQPETVDNALTYPLPPVSTVTGAIREACGWDHRHDMRVAIQGGFAHKTKRKYTRRVVYSSIMPDRGYFCKMTAPGFSNAVEIIAEPRTGPDFPAGSRDFRTGTGYNILRPDLMREYLQLCAAADDNVRRRKALDAQKKTISAAEKEARKEINTKIKAEKEEMQKINERKNAFCSFEKIPGWIEILSDVKLTIHILSDDAEEILENIYNLKSIGRAEDFVNVVSAEIVDCAQAPAGSEIRQSAYVNNQSIKNFRNTDGGDVHGIVYYLNTKYDIVDGKRIFEKIKCNWVSQIILCQPDTNTFTDSAGLTFSLI